MKNKTTNQQEVKNINTIWTKHKDESFGTLQVYLRSGAVKYFVENDKKDALKEAKKWLFINKIL